jgi:hypothetical protein
MDIYDGMLKIESDKAAAAQQAMASAAEQAGMGAAAQGDTPALPDAPSATPGADNLPTPNQPPDQSMPK